MNTKTIMLLVALAVLPLAALAQVTEAEVVGDAVEVTTAIVAIDAADRLITLEDEDGDIVTLYAGPAVKRFDELKVGDTVTFRYAEAVVADVRKADASAEPSATVTAVAERGEGERPSGAVARQVSVTVKVKAIDPAVPSVTIEAVDGTTRTFGVAEEKLEGVDVGDLVDITYTQALAISVE